ncbi:MAG: DedA family protein [Marinilabiliaceae bacterium]|nr:DedA family protein [Marinilabiliaceae bacterium]
MFTASYVGLFLSAFVSATLFPMASEAVLSAMLVGGFDVVACVSIATVGNWLGSLTTYAIGRLGNLAAIERWFRIKPEDTQRYERYARKYGYWVGLLIWVPFVGDILAVCMGLVRTPILLSAAMIFIGKLLRYIFFAYVTLGIIS